MAQSHFTTHEVAKFCDVTVPGVIRWIKTGKLRAYKTPGGHRRIEPGDLMEFMKRFGLPIPPELLLAQGKRVLAVDDEQEVLYVVERVVKKLLPEAEFQTAANGFEAGQKSAEFLPQLVFLDLMLPGIDGFKVCQALRKNPKTKNIKILAMSGLPEAEVKERILAAGADAFISKPFDVPKLEKIIAHLIPTA